MTGRRPGAARGRRPTPSEPRRDGPDPGAVLSRAVTRVDYDEFGLFHENAEEFGLPYDGPPSVRREAVDVAPGRRLSALVWGTGDPELVLLHGGAQNAHTWDTVALALDRPLVAVDLPGHGHSDDPARPARSPRTRSTSPRPSGPSRRGPTSSSACRSAASPRSRWPPTTPTSSAGSSSSTSRPPSPRPRRPPSPLSSTVLPRSPTSTRSSPGPSSTTRRDRCRPCGEASCTTRRSRPTGAGSGATPAERGPGGDHQIGPDFAGQWDTVSGLTVPLLLVRGMAAGSVVDDDDEAEVLRRQPDAEVARVDGAGHSVQGDQPVALARLIDQFAP